MKSVKTLLLFTVFATMLSCQKEIDPEGVPVIPTPTGDSSWFVSSFTRAGIEYYDVNSNMADSSKDYYTYLPGKIVHKAYYIYSGGTDSTQYSYYYNNAGDLTKYENDFTAPGNLSDVQSVNFSYTGGKLSQANIVYFGGGSGIQQFAYESNDRIVTVYDTASGQSNSDQILIYKYYLNADKAVDSAVFISAALFPGDPNDTALVKIGYDLNKNISSIIDDGDTINYTMRESKGSEIGATIKKVLSNLSFHFFMLKNSNDALFFNNAAGNIPANYLQYPPITATQLSAFNQPIQGTFINTFNADNLLTKQVVPDKFGSKQYGPSIFEFNYIKLPK